METKTDTDNFLADDLNLPQYTNGYFRTTRYWKIGF